MERLRTAMSRICSSTRGDWLVTIDQSQSWTPQLWPLREACWEVTRKEDSRLCCALSIRSRGDGSTDRKVRPMDGLFGLAMGLFLETCCHSSQASLEWADEFASYCRPWDNMYDVLPLSESGSHVTVVAAHGVEGLRLASVAEEHLGDGKSYVIRGDACLACCLKLCRTTGVACLIL